MTNYKTVPEADLAMILEAVQVSKKMSVIIDAAFEEVDQLRDDFLSDKDFRPSISQNEIFINSTDLFFHLFKEFDVKHRASTEYPYEVFVVIDGVTINSLANDEELEATRGRDKQ